MSSVEMILFYLIWNGGPKILLPLARSLINAIQYYKEGSNGLWNPLATFFSIYFLMFFSLGFLCSLGRIKGGRHLPWGPGRGGKGGRGGFSYSGGEL